MNILPQPRNRELEYALDMAMRGGTVERKILAEWRARRTSWGPDAEDHSLRRRIDSFLGDHVKAAT